MTRIFAIVVVLGALCATTQASAEPSRTERQTYVGGFSVLAFSCTEAEWRVGPTTVDADTSVGGACFDMQGETSIELRLEDVTGAAVPAYYEFRGCENCGCYYCPTLDQNCELCGQNTGTWGFICNTLERDIPAGADQLVVLVLEDDLSHTGGCNALVPPAAGTITAQLYP